MYQPGFADYITLGFLTHNSQLTTHNSQLTSTKGSTCKVYFYLSITLIFTYQVKTWQIKKTAREVAANSAWNFLTLYSWLWLEENYLEHTLSAQYRQRIRQFGIPLKNPQA